MKILTPSYFLFLLRSNRLFNDDIYGPINIITLASCHPDSVHIYTHRPTYCYRVYDLAESNINYTFVYVWRGQRK